MEVVQVQPRDSYLHYIYVDTKNTAIQWSFMTKRKNIAFGLYRHVGRARLPSSSEFVFQARQRTPSAQNDYVASTCSQESDHTDTEITETTDQSHFADRKHYANSFQHLLHRRSSSNNSSAWPAASRISTSKSASAKLKELEDLLEVLPIQYCNSANTKVEGFYVAKEPGNYVLVFDNTFSRHTPKILSFSVTLVAASLLRSRPMSVDGSRDGVSGWLLKKKRKKLQGWAKRWFHLSPSGVLSYSTSPTSVIRGSIQILVATISINPLQRLIHIDSGTMLYHLKALTAEDQEKWTKALREYRSPIIPDEQDVEQRIPSPPLLSTHDKISLLHQVRVGAEAVRTMQADINHYMRLVDQLLALVDEGGVKTSLALQLAAFKRKVSFGVVDDLDAWVNIERKLALVGRGSSSQDGSRPLSPPTLFPPFTTLSDGQDEKDPSIRANPSLYARHENVSVARSWQESVLSEQYYDAEEILLSGEEDYSDAGDDNIDEDDEDEENDDDDDDADNIASTYSKSMEEMTSGSSQIVRRRQLPSPGVGDTFSALSLFRKNVGKDLSNISMPITMNEPLNMLQRACEELEYSELLDKAAGLSNSLDRLVHVAVFAVSGYASTQYRTGRKVAHQRLHGEKPFNPMMTETYENIRPDKGFRFMAEKVSHNPLIIAAHTESRNYVYWQCIKIRSKFWGKSMEFINEGTYHVTLTGHHDHYTYSKPSSWLRNMIAGEKYLEHIGELKVVNHSTGEYAIVAFKEGIRGGFFIGTPKQCNEVVMTVYDAKGVKTRRVIGKWNEMLAEEVGKNRSQLSVLWTARSPLQDYMKYYGFTQFSVELNEITDIERDKLPKTDTRLRPDQRLYEQGLVDEAEAEKKRIEQRQRERRKELEKMGVEWKPRWFVLEKEEYADSSVVPSSSDDDVARTWQYGNQYWQARESGQWPNDLYDLW